MKRRRPPAQADPEITNREGGLKQKLTIIYLFFF